MIASILADAALILAAPVAAEEGQFAADGQAKEWGLMGEEKARFKAHAVDVLCELGGDGVANCGDGRRQPGLLREADGALVLPLKNGQAAFTGAATVLQPYCGKDVVADGVLIGDEEYTQTRFYLTRLIREQGSEDRAKASLWTKEWAKQHPELNPKKPWFRKEPRVLGAIEKDGYRGLGAEADKAFIEYHFE